jgi:hypothetical protein
MVPEIESHPGHSMVPALGLRFEPHEAPSALARPYQLAQVMVPPDRRERLWLLPLELRCQQVNRARTSHLRRGPVIT